MGSLAMHAMLMAVLMAGTASALHTARTARRFDATAVVTGVMPTFSNGACVKDAIAGNRSLCAACHSVTQSVCDLADCPAATEKPTIDASVSPACRMCRDRMASLHNIGVAQFRQYCRVCDATERAATSALRIATGNPTAVSPTLCIPLCGAASCDFMNSTVSPHQVKPVCAKLLASRCPALAPTPVRSIVAK